MKALFSFIQADKKGLIKCIKTGNIYEFRFIDSGKYQKIATLYFR